MSTPQGGYGQGGYGQGGYGGGGGRGGRFSQATEDAYARLPEFYREADVDGVLKRWISAIFDQVGEMRELRERFALEPARVGFDRPTGEVLTRAASNLTVVGPWEAVQITGGSVALRTDGPDARAEWPVTVAGGTYRLDLRYEAGPNRGRLRVTVDDADLVTIDTYSPAAELADYVKVAVGLVLPRGSHTVRVHWTGAKRTESTGTSVALGGVRLVNQTGQALDGSDLVDPGTADDAWLPWLAQLVGARLSAELTTAQRRDAVRQAARLQSGSQQALIDAARTALTGNRTVVVHPHRKVAAGVLQPGGPWDLAIVTNASETPSGAGVLDAVRRLDAKPVGVLLHHTVYAGSWTDFHPRYPTWAAIHAQPTWAKLQEASL